MKEETKNVIRGLATIAFIIMMIFKIFGPVLLWLWSEFILPLIGLIIYGTVKIAPLGVFLAVIRGDKDTALGWCVAAIICYIIGNLLI